MLKNADALRKMPLGYFAEQAKQINDSDAVSRIFAAPEWQELSEDGQAWLCALVRETLAQAAEQRQ